MFCSKCGSELPDNARFCGRCGAEVRQNRTVNNQKSPDFSNGQFNYQPQNGQMQSGRQNSGGFSGYNGMTNVIQTAGNAAGGVVREANKAKRNMLLALLVVGVFAIFFLLYNVFLKTGTPEDTIAKLEKGMNNLDQEMVLECFDDQMNSLYSGSLGLLDSLSGLPVSDFADMASGLGGLMSATGLSPSITIEVHDITYSGDKDSCLAYVTIYVEYMGESEAEDMELPMVLNDREWLISMSDISSFYSF